MILFLVWLVSLTNLFLRHKDYRSTLANFESRVWLEARSYMTLVALLNWRDVGISICTRNMLSPEEQTVYGRLSTARPDAPEKAVVITDFAGDYHGIAAMIVLREFHRLKLIQLIGVIVNLRPSHQRAAFGRGILDALDLHQIPIAPGTDGTDQEVAFSGDSSITGTPDFQHGHDLLGSIISKCNGKEIHLICLSSMQDIVEFMTENKVSVSMSLASVHMQGGGFMRDGLLVPDESAANNRFNLKAAETWLQFLHDHRICSYSYPEIPASSVLPTQVFEDMAATEHRIGVYLRDVQMKQEYALILPFLNAIVYDVLPALGSAGEDVTNALKIFTPSSGHIIVGQSKEKIGVNSEQLKITISALMKGGLEPYDSDLGLERIFCCKNRLLFLLLFLLFVGFLLLPAFLLSILKDAALN